MRKEIQNIYINTRGIIQNSNSKKIQHIETLLHMVQTPLRSLLEV